MMLCTNFGESSTILASRASATNSWFKICHNRPPRFTTESECELRQGGGLNENKRDYTSREGEKVFDEDSVAAQGTPECPLEEHPFWVKDIPYKGLQQC